MNWYLLDIVVTSWLSGGLAIASFVFLVDGHLILALVFMMMTITYFFISLHCRNNAIKELRAEFERISRKKK